MTWGEFKVEVERQGVKDDHELDYVDYDSNDTFSGLECRRLENEWIIENEDY